MTRCVHYNALACSLGIFLIFIFLIIFLGKSKPATQASDLQFLLESQISSRPHQCLKRKVNLLRKFLLHNYHFSLKHNFWVIFGAIMWIMTKEVHVRFMQKKMFIFELKTEKMYVRVFFHSFYATDFNFGTKNNGGMI